MNKIIAQPPIRCWYLALDFHDGIRAVAIGKWNPEESGVRQEGHAEFQIVGIGRSCVDYTVELRRICAAIHGIAVMKMCMAAWRMGRAKPHVMLPFRRAQSIATPIRRLP